MSFKLRAAVADEAAYLSDLAVRSKAYWGYSDEFMRACSQELFLAPDAIEDGGSDYTVCEWNNKVIGFYALRSLSAEEVELDALFVDPEYIGSGFGRILINRAKQQAAKKGGRVLVIQGDPNAKGFYTAVGGKLAGLRESASIQGRFLPVFHIQLSDSGIENV